MRDICHDEHADVVELGGDAERVDDALDGALVPRHSFLVMNVM